MAETLTLHLTQVGKNGPGGETVTKEELCPKHLYQAMKSVVTH